MKYRKQWLAILCILVLFTVGGCATFEELFGSKGGGTAQELAWDGIDEYDNGNYRTAVEKFEQLKDWYPFSKYAILAELKIADANYHLKQYEEAVAAYEEFESLHPRNEAVPYVLYQIGMCYFEQVDTPDRDQSKAANAIENFERLIRQYPDDEYATKARINISRCLKNMAMHDYLVGQYYFKTKHYKAALGRFRNVVQRYPDIGMHQNALTYLLLCEQKLARQEKE